MEKIKFAEKPSILYVDDEKGNLVSFKAAFRSKYNVFTAISAEKGMEILEVEPIELIITDQRMPEMTGVQFLESIISTYPDVTRMILTGFSDTEAIIDAINSGRVYRYITKPWDAKELEMAIDSGVSRHRLEKKNELMIKELREQIAQKNNILNIYQQYVPENVIGNTLVNEKLSTESEVRIISVVFAQLHDFHELTENLLPEDKMHILNQFMSLADEVVTEHNGSINKYVSDGFFAFFGAPVSHIDNHKNAADCGIELMKLIRTIDMHKVNRDIDDDKKMTLSVTVHTDEVLVGNVGSHKHLDYTVVGNIMREVLLLNMLLSNQENSLFVTEETYHHIKDDGFLLEPYPMQKNDLLTKLPSLYQILPKDF